MASANSEILVAYKRSRYEHVVSEQGEENLQALADAGNLEVDALQTAHDSHYRTVEGVTDYLDSHGIAFEARHRADVESTDTFDLVLTVGGDGTVLDCSHQVGETPLLAINSHPGTSVGYFCAGVLEDVPDLLDGALEGSLDATSLARFGVAVDDEPVGPPVLNDILFGHANPAAVSRYALEVGDGDPEDQRSSGVWVSTAAGSTAAIRSAGGHVLPLTSRTLQYAVREPYPDAGRGYRHLRGFQPIHRPFRLHSRMATARLYFDGPHIADDIGLGDVVSIRDDAPDLTILGLTPTRGRRTRP